MVRFAFSAALLFASLLISGAHKGDIQESVAAREKRAAAELLVSGVSESGQWQRCAAANPMFFISIETGTL